MTQPWLTTQNLPLPVIVALVVVVLFVVVRLYRRDRTTVSQGVGATLLTLRAVFVTTLLLVLADPRCAIDEQQTDPGTVLVMFDVSESSTLTDPYRSVAQKIAEAKALGLVEDAAQNGLDNPETLRRLTELSRRELTELALRTSWWTELERRFNVVGYAFNDSAQRYDPTATSSSVLPTAGGPTNLSAPLATELIVQQDSNVVGVVLFTDGHHHSPDDPRLETSSLSASRVPLLAVGLGTLEKPTDIAVSQIEATGKTFSGDEIHAQVVVEASGLTASTTSLRVETDGQLVKEFTLSLPEGESTQRLPIQFPAGDPGRKRFTFSVPPQPEEVDHKNNTQALWAEVLSEKAKVLLLDGRPRWEWRYLREAWNRDENIDVTPLLVESAPHRRLPDDYPAERSELFDFDVVVLGDVPSQVFSREQREDLHDFVVAQAGTLIFVAGADELPYGWLDSPLSAILPIEPLVPSPSPQFGASIAREGIRIELTELGEEAALTRILPGRSRNVELWEMLPEHYWLNPIGDVVEGAEVLATVTAETGTNLPGANLLNTSDPTLRRARRKFLRSRGAALVRHSFGAGRVLYIGVDSTWRWRYRLGDELYTRFWGQVVRWGVAERLTAEDRHARLGTAKFLYSSTDEVRIDALVEDAAGQPYVGSVDAVLSTFGKQGGARISLRHIPRSGGRYRGAVRVNELPTPATPTSADQSNPSSDDARNADVFRRYTVALSIPNLAEYNTLNERANIEIVVAPAESLEIRDTTCNVSLLEELADSTGGTFLPFSQFRKTLEYLHPRPKTREITVVYAPWDFPTGVAILLLSVLIAEWVLRKRRNLI